MQKKPVTKYIKNYSAPKANALLGELSQFPVVDTLCLIPICCEEANVESQILSLKETQSKSGKTVAVVYLLNNSNLASVSTRIENERTIEFINQLPSSKPNDESSFYTLALDCFSEGNELKQGVGEARKILGDLAILLWESGKVRSPQVFMTDGDASFRKYFEYELGEGQVCAVFPFVHKATHEMNNEETQAMNLYDKYLRYYTESLRWAGSKYAFYTLGSLLTFDLEAYSKVRGFPQREAGEDFYFLNKMAKVGSVESIFDQDYCITLQGRVSTRVPFGTGPSVDKISSLIVEGKTYFTYSPKVFYALKSLLEYAQKSLEMKAEPLPNELLLKVLENEAIKVQIEDIANTEMSFKNKTKKWNDWFDGFRTLKLVHFLRDNFFSDVPLESEEVSTFIATELIESESKNNRGHHC